jgi:hypothetical protein
VWTAASRGLGNCQARYPQGCKVYVTTATHRAPDGAEIGRIGQVSLNWLVPSGRGGTLRAEMQGGTMRTPDRRLWILSLAMLLGAAAGCSASETNNTTGTVTGGASSSGAATGGRSGSTGGTASIGGQSTVSTSACTVGAPCTTNGQQCTTSTKTVCTCNNRRYGGC